MSIAQRNKQAKKKRKDASNIIIDPCDQSIDVHDFLQSIALLKNDYFIITCENAFQWIIPYDDKSKTML